MGAVKVVGKKTMVLVKCGMMSAFYIEMCRDMFMIYKMSLLSDKFLYFFPENIVI